ncbi:MAG: repair protein RecN [Firmicutes bacterium]|nr:repair protein RecN [Bacillota bacterium]
MLKTLSVNNFALIEQATVDLGSGLNVLSGETGAGKSIIIDALDTVLGSRAYVESIRGGCDFFRVEAVFELENGHTVADILTDHGIPLEDGSNVIISRRLSRQGKNTILINGCHVTLNVLRQIGDLLVDMHGQHENQTLLRPAAYLSFLDEYHPDIPEKLATYRQLFSKWNSTSDELEKLKSDSRQRAQRLDMLEWQTREIAAATLRIEEEENLENEVQLLTHAEKIATAVNRSYSLLSTGSDRTGNVVSLLAEVQKNLEQACRYDGSLQKYLSLVNESLYQLEDAASALLNYCEGFEFDPARLSLIQERLDVIDKLKKKYGSTIADILVYNQQALKELSAIENYETTIETLEEMRTKLEAGLQTLASDLSQLRTKSAAEISAAVTNEFTGLALPKAKILINVSQLPKYTVTGLDEVSVLFSANPGEEPKQLNKVASGGELSRIALAIKAVTANRQSTGTMVFDEIDAGIGGQTAAKVAEKIAEVAWGKQVLCITHLPQIVAMADQHIYVSKQVSGERTATLVATLSKEERTQEVARMLSGDDVTSASLKNAKELLTLAENKKRKNGKRT